MQVEAEARRILRAKIKAMPWHAGLPSEERKRLIEADVERWWHLEVKEAARRLRDRHEPHAADGSTHEVQRHINPKTNLL